MLKDFSIKSGPRIDFLSKSLDGMNLGKCEKNNGYNFWLHSFALLSLSVFSVTRCWSKKKPKCFQKLPKKQPQQFYIILIFFKIAQNVNNNLGYFCYKFRRQNFQKSANLVTLSPSHDCRTFIFTVCGCLSICSLVHTKIMNFFSPQSLSSFSQPECPCALG